GFNSIGLQSLIPLFAVFEYQLVTVRVGLFQLIGSLRRRGKPVRFLDAAEIRKLVQVARRDLASYGPVMLQVFVAHFEPTQIDGGRRDIRQYDCRGLGVIGRRRNPGSISDLYRRRCTVSSYLERDHPPDHVLALTD